jgi:hypothetical protein
MIVAKIEPLGQLIGALLEVSAAPIPHRHGVKLDEQPHRFGGGCRLPRPFALGSFCRHAFTVIPAIARSFSRMASTFSQLS